MNCNEILEIIRPLLINYNDDYDLPTDADWDMHENYFNTEFSDTYKELIRLISKYEETEILNISSGKTNGGYRVLTAYKIETELGNWPEIMIPIYYNGIGDYDCLNSNEGKISKVYTVYHEDRSVEVVADSIEEWIVELPKSLSDERIIRDSSDDDFSI